MKLKTVGKNPNKPMIALGEEGKKIWYFAEKPAYDSAKQNLQEGDEIEIKLADQERDGLKVITFIKKTGTVTPPDKPTETGHKCTECGYALKDDKYSKCYLCNKKAKANKTIEEKTPINSSKCIDCGKELKDSKYKKCYTCNQKNPVKAEKKSTYTLSTQESIERQNVNNAVSRSLIALQGQVELNSICDVIDMLWEKFHSKLK